jgi:hypothetical protein
MKYLTLDVKQQSINQAYNMTFDESVKETTYRLVLTDTKDCNCFITLNENESETKSIRVLIKQYQSLRNVMSQPIKLFK